ncbi:MFS transporter [Thalassotalea sp. PP2-459]|uniref:MFS transporter n=1 Tax=Thalassotalea sp. PP2-459 TaxID=1742724 RepID=UPI000944C28A|nr:MFS transporter [Thalassotalea sp. PP2-459]OKY27180.1 hypothetical protein BI291_09635 [Thalassotalea sp. PP2-459]
MNTHLNRTEKNSLFTYFLLAFIAMAGLAYINFLPGVVNALAVNVSYSSSDAGQIVASNSYGGIFGSMIAIFLVRHIAWRKATFACLALLVLIDLGTSRINGYSLMLSWRLMAGVIGGVCTGIVFSVLARLQSPDRAFGFLLFIQFLIGALVIGLLPTLEPILGTYTVFYIMASISMISLLFVLIVPKLTKIKATDLQNSVGLIFSKYSTLLLLSIFLYQTAASAIYAYSGLIGLHANISHNSTNIYIATTGLLGLLGALMPVISGNRFGRRPPLIIGIIASITAAVLLATLNTSLSFVIALALLFFSWPALLAYLLAMTAQFDNSGRLAAMSAVASSLGIASGPMLASMLVEKNDFNTMLYTCVLLFVISGILLYKTASKADKTCKKDPIKRPETSPLTLEQ